MKKFKKFISVFLAITTVLCLFAVTASAAFYTIDRRHVYDVERFQDEEWEHTRHYISDGEYIGRLVYGYDTDYVDEDYAWAYGASCNSQAIIEAGSEEYYADPAVQNYYSKVQVTHDENDVYYYFRLSVNYSNVTGYLDTNTNENT